MPVSQGGNGRDHNPKGFLVWMTGAGIKGGVSYGETDEIGYRAAKDPVTVHDLHATMLHLLGMDHKRLTYLHNGRRYRLTDVAGEFFLPNFAPKNPKLFFFFFLQFFSPYSFSARAAVRFLSGV